MARVRHNEGVTMNRREFLRQAGMAIGFATTGAYAYAAQPDGSRGRGFIIVREAADQLATTPPVEWAATRLRDALVARGVSVSTASEINAIPAGVPSVMAAGRANQRASQLARTAGVSV